MIKLIGAGFSYKTDGGAVDALRGVSVEIERGKFTAVLGRNGSGKSTLAKLLNALLLPTEGRVLVFGLDTADGQNLFEIRKNVGMVFQNPDNQTVASIVEDDIAFGPENIGVEREEIARRVAWALKAVDMEEYRHSAPFNMSGGQKQRIAVAGILALKPAVIIFDESTSMLDPKGRGEIMAVIKTLIGDGISVILITHDMGEAVEADRVIVLGEGIVVLDGAPREVFRSEKLPELSLKPPIAASVAMDLRERGMPVGGVLTEGELVGELYRLLK
ncbi:MAG: energy-coupling factor transporter ATPase [Clostridiales bacterium]|jgi:energy-coupling factor transport system ATP-binding protein|nr:energy-coupling factor transporter ATPase [Clostridiales bacterium]